MRTKKIPKVVRKQIKYYQKLNLSVGIVNLDDKQSILLSDSYRQRKNTNNIKKKFRPLLHRWVLHHRFRPLSITSQLNKKKFDYDP